jgi:hypothetical protein
VLGAVAGQESRRVDGRRPAQPPAASGVARRTPPARQHCRSLRARPRAAGTRLFRENFLQG